MAIRVLWHESAGYWELSTGEVFTLGEVDDLMKKTDWQSSRRFLWDLTVVASGPDSTPEIRAAAGLAREVQKRWEGSRIAVLVARDFDFGVARMYQVYAEDGCNEVSIFREKQIALDWLLDESLHED